MNEKLKPCPFCGDNPTLLHPDEEGGDYVIGCYNECCGYSYERARDTDKQKVINAWNTRAMSDNEKFLRKILQDMHEIRNDKISSMNQNNQPAYIMALMREDDIYQTAQKFLQESANIKSQPKIDKWVLYEDKDTNMWQCPACKEVIQLMEGTPQENRYNFCPTCGKRLIMEVHS